MSADEARARLARTEAMLAQLRTQYDVLISGFKFDEARDLVPRIEAAERQRAVLAASLPPVVDAAPPPVHRVHARRRRR
jgi:hypothetical protein